MQSFSKYIGERSPTRLILVHGVPHVGSCATHGLVQHLGVVRYDVQIEEVRVVDDLNRISIEIESNSVLVIFERRDCCGGFIDHDFRINQVLPYVLERQMLHSPTHLDDGAEDITVAFSPNIRRRSQDARPCDFANANINVSVRR